MKILHPIDIGNAKTTQYTNMRSYFHFGCEQGKHLILSSERETGQNPDGKGINIYSFHFPHLPFKCLGIKRKHSARKYISLLKECGISENVSKTVGVESELCGHTKTFKTKIMIRMITSQF